MAEMEYITSQGYIQDGLTVESYRALERPLTLPIYYTPADERTDYWEHRERLINILSAESAPLTIGVFRADATERKLTSVYPSPGLVMELEEGNFSINEPILLTAFDPVWQAGTTTTQATSQTQDTELTFPITFPILFGLSGLRISTGDFTYNGNWRTYPTITLDGPYSRVSLTNQTTGASITLFVGIASGEQRILSYTGGGGFSLVDGSGVNRISEAEISSNFVDFYITRGTNRIDAVFTGGTLGTSEMIVTYTIRYIGV